MYPLFLLLYSVSGFSLLAIETMWIRDAGLRMGNTVYSSSWVIAVFFLCAALGNRAGARILRRFPRPGIVYGAGESAAALSALLLYLIRGILFTPLPGVDILEKLYPFLLAGIPSCAAGISFPALAELQVSSGKRLIKAGPLYTANLLGASAGVLFGGLLLPFYAGYSVSFIICCLVMLLAGVSAAAVSFKSVSGTGTEGKRESPGSRLPEETALVVIFMSGVLSLGLEIAVLHYFNLISHSSLFAVSAVFFAFILNLGTGSLVAVIFGRWVRDRLKLLSGILLYTGCAVMFSHLLFHVLLKRTFLLEQESLIVFMLKDAGVAWLVLLPLVGGAGAVFPAAWDILKKGSSEGDAFGRIFSLNKLGSAVGVFLVPFVLLPLFGLPGTLLSIGFAYGILGIAAVSGTGNRKLSFGAGSGVFVCFAVSLFLVRVPVAEVAGESVIDVETGSGGVVCVTEDALSSRHIILNHSYMLNGTDRALSSQCHEAWVPLFFHPSPRNVIFIGMASGISADAVLDFSVDKLTAVEILPEVARMAKEHFSKWNSRLFSDPRAEIRIDDGRHVVNGSEGADVIICDLFHPAREGTASMYSRDFFRIARSRLNDGGIFCLWLASYQMNENIMGIIFRTFLDVYPNVLLVRGNYDPLQPIIGLIGSETGFDISEEYVHRRLSDPGPENVKGKSLFFRSAVNMRTLIIGDLRSKEKDFALYPVNTDDRPVIAFEGPRKIPDGMHIRGFTLLDFLGKRFSEPLYPSCILNTSSPSDIHAGIRAGNYLFAASVSLIPIPGASFEKALKRNSQVLRFLQTARTLLPGLDAAPGDLEK